MPSIVACGRRTGPAAGSNPTGRAPAGLRVSVHGSLHTLRMDRNAYRDDNDTGQPDAYWRRRVIALVAGLTLLGLLAWAFSGGGKPASTAPKSARSTGILPAAADSGSPTSPPPGANGAGATPVGPAASLPFPSVTNSGTGQPDRTFRLLR